MLNCLALKYCTRVQVSSNGVQARYKTLTAISIFISNMQKFCTKTFRRMTWREKKLSTTGIINLKSQQNIKNPFSSKALFLFNCIALHYIFKENISYV
jgi:hypothetical protein